MVVTDDGHMVTGRQEPRLVLVSLACEGGRVCLSGPDMEELQFPIAQPDNPVIDCRSHSAQMLWSWQKVLSKVLVLSADSSVLGQFLPFKSSRK